MQTSKQLNEINNIIASSKGKAIYPDFYSWYSTIHPKKR